MKATGWIVVAILLAAVIVGGAVWWVSPQRTYDKYEQMNCSLLGGDYVHDGTWRCDR